jgi:chromosomal replication initiator protein
VNSNRDVLLYLRDYLGQSMTPTVVQAWFDDADVADISERKIVLSTTSEFKRGIIQNRYASAVRSAMAELFGADFDVSVVVSEGAALPKDSADNDKKRYQFDRFVVGDSNKFAAAAAQAVAENPGKAYNPLFIYGGSGLGKTHLLYSILNSVRASFPDFVIRDFTGETFANELASAIRTKTQEDFRNKYRSADMILADDIQFIGGRDFSQEEFFFTFNTLYDDGKQIVITSDRPPRDLPILTERLRTRFEEGLLVDVKPPDFETRMAIIKSKSIRAGLPLSDDIVVFIAETITANIRQLEGTVNKLDAYRNIFGDLTLEDARRAVGDLIRENPGINPTPEYIIREVCSFYNIEEKDILGKSRQSDIVLPRQVAMYIIRSLTDNSLQTIGDKVFRRDHTTVMHSVDKIERERLTDPRLDSEINIIIENIKGL